MCVDVTVSTCSNPNVTFSTLRFSMHAQATVGELKAAGKTQAKLKINIYDAAKSKFFSGKDPSTYENAKLQVNERENPL